MGSYIVLLGAEVKDFYDSLGDVYGLLSEGF